MKTKYEIEINDITVSKNGWFMFDYKLTIDGKLTQQGNYDGSYSSQTAETFRKVLKRGWANQLVLQRYF